MKNTYRVKGNVAYIRIPAVNGKTPLPETDLVIDLRNLEKAMSFPGTWGQSIHQKTGEIYIRGRHFRKDGYVQPVFARYLANPLVGENTRHIDGNPLNCLECNLVNVYACVHEVQGLTPIGPPPEPEKALEPKKPQEDIKPVKGVSFHKGKRKWEVKPYYQGKRQNLGYWPESQLAEANEAAEYVRQYGPDAYKALIQGGK